MIVGEPFAIENRLHVERICDFCLQKISTDRITKRLKRLKLNPDYKDYCRRCCGKLKMSGENNRRI